MLSTEPRNPSRDSSQDIEVEELTKQRGDWDQTKGQEITANALSQYGDKIDVVFCNNDAMALGALQAIEAAGQNCKQRHLLSRR